MVLRRRSVPKSRPLLGGSDLRKHAELLRGAAQSRNSCSRHCDHGSHTARRQGVVPDIAVAGPAEELADFTGIMVGAEGIEPSTSPV